jgi:aspartate ammonia-lyase
MQTRSEKDSLGERKIPAEAYYGIQTHRAMENFQISGLRPKQSYVEATVHIKMAAAKVNQSLGLLDKRRSDAIVAACEEIVQGKLREWFVVDVYQAGAGTSHNMNANEVIANRAIELLGGTKGDYSLIHPNDHVNMAQSTNDVCPTAIRISAVLLAHFLLDSLKRTENAFAAKAKEFAAIIKSGRTHLRMPAGCGSGRNSALCTCLRKHEAILRLAVEPTRNSASAVPQVGTTG